MNQELLQQAFRATQMAFPDARPTLGLILGTGWHSAIKTFQIKRELAYRDIPGLGCPTVSGHLGQLLWGQQAGLETFIFQGRRHWYEGQGWDPIAIPIYLLQQFGADTVVLTNAAGSLQPDWPAGTLMLIDDHINAMNAHPLIGPHAPNWGARFPDQSQVYNADLKIWLEQAAQQLGLRLPQGVYLATSGPSYETPAEVRAFQAWGADAVGSSTVPEAILANAAGLRVAGLSCLTNFAAGIGTAPLAHAAIQAAAAQAANAMAAIINEFWKELAANDQES